MHCSAGASHERWRSSPPAEGLSSNPCDLLLLAKYGLRVTATEAHECPLYGARADPPA